MNDDDASLLRRYAEDRSDEAFAEFVRRRIGLVYSVALRTAGGGEHEARDVAQIVFVEAARRAGELGNKRNVLGWLFVSARNAAANVVRTEIRRRKREQEAQTLLDVNSGEPADEWDQVRPALDETISALKPIDREALLLRFFGGCTFPEVAASLGISEEAARKRTDRAVHKLNGLLVKRHITSTATALAVWLAEQPAIGAPPGLAEDVIRGTVSRVVAARTAVSVGSTALLKSVSATAGVFLAAIAVVFWYHAGSHESRATVSLSNRVETQTPLVRHAAVYTALPAAESATGRASTGSAEFRTIGTFRDMGRETALAAFETEIWAREHMEIQKLADCVAYNDPGRAAAVVIVKGMSPDQKDEYGTPERMAAMLGAYNISHFTGAAILNEHQTPDGQVALDFEFQRVNGETTKGTWNYRATADGWKRVIPDQLVIGWEDYFQNGDKKK